MHIPNVSPHEELRECGGRVSNSIWRLGRSRLWQSRWQQAWEKRVEGLGCCSVTQCFMSNLKVPDSRDTRKAKQKRMLEEALPLWAWARHMQKAMLMLVIRQKLMFRDTQNAKQLKAVVFALFLMKCSFPSLSWRDLIGVGEMAQCLTVRTCSYRGQVFESQHPSQEVQDHERTPALTCRHIHRYIYTHTL